MISPPFARACGFTLPDPQVASRHTDIPSLRKLEQFDQIMSDRRLWSQARVETVKNNLKNRVIVVEGENLVHDTTHYVAYSSMVLHSRNGFPWCSTLNRALHLRSSVDGRRETSMHDLPPEGSMLPARHGWGSIRGNRVHSARSHRSQSSPDGPALQGHHASADGRGKSDQAHQARLQQRTTHPAREPSLPGSSRPFTDSVPPDAPTGVTRDFPHEVILALIRGQPMLRNRRHHVETENLHSRRPAPDHLTGNSARFRVVRLTLRLTRSCSFRGLCAGSRDRQDVRRADAITP